jgi:hypothetical protein
MAELGREHPALPEDLVSLTEMRMFGGLAFLIQGNMAVSASSKGGLLLRIDPDENRVSDQRAARAALRDARPADGRLASYRRRGA